ncbi:hypothetical protein L1987_36347 [Smallanthus sonchifolius]|uniref:Uncharacterized protein n=1 Tax=Smallanthus sonchifolius TaxID=185202 RepID=A0ACB9HDA7_9ASTR|nr:hypothetical protein L1987_36347 [Smallanthus sonchifolius]
MRECSCNLDLREDIVKVGRSSTRHSVSSPISLLLLRFKPFSIVFILSNPQQLMAIAAVVVLPIGLLFLLSGLIINFLQALFFVLVQRICIWLEIVWLFDWWAHIKVDLYIDSETLELMGKEHALLICNHKGDIDWMGLGSGCLGSTLSLIKKSLKFLPVIGWSMWFTEYIFLERSWSKDENTLKAKPIAAQEYAIAMKLPIPRNLLIPRTKGFVAAVNHLRSFVPAIYNCTVAIPKDEPLPTILRMFRGRSSTVHVQIKRHLTCELPETDSGSNNGVETYLSKRMLHWSYISLKTHLKALNATT